MNINLEAEDESPEPYEDGPRSNYGAGYGNNIPTAEEFLSNEIDRVAFPHIDDWLEDDSKEARTLKEVLVSFAKLHVKAQ